MNGNQRELFEIKTYFIRTFQLRLSQDQPGCPKFLIEKVFLFLKSISHFLILFIYTQRNLGWDRNRKVILSNTKSRAFFVPLFFTKYIRTIHTSRLSAPPAFTPAKIKASGDSLGRKIYQRGSPVKRSASLAKFLKLSSIPGKTLMILTTKIIDIVNR